VKRVQASLASLTALVLGVGLVACSTEGGSDTPSPDNSDAGDGLVLGLVIPQGDKYFQGIQTGLEEAARADGNTVVVVNSNNDAAAEATAVQNLIQRQVDVILIQPATSSAGSIATMRSVKDAGISLICYGNCTDDAASSELVDGVVQSDNTALGTATGEAAAAYIESELGGTATIGMLNCDSFEVCTLRKAGFQQALEDVGVTVTYAADQEGYLADKATPIATNMLSANPEINLFWAANEGGTLGEIAAVRSAGKNIPVFGTDISDQLAEALLDANNLLQATTGQDPVGTAQDAYAMALKAVAGETNDPFEIGVPGTTYVRSDADAVNAYLGK
jgi:simple sugar transport system substrate-binding protein